MLRDIIVIYVTTVTGSIFQNRVIANPYSKKQLLHQTQIEGI